MTKAKKARKITRKRTGKYKVMDEVYVPSLDALIDRLFQEALNLNWTWFDLAENSGLSETTINNLGHKVTKFPQFRTMQLMAYAVGGHVSFEHGKKVQSFKITWKPDSFNRRNRAA